MVAQPNGFGDRENATGKKLRILVADDDPDAVKTLATVLQHEGHEVREVYRGDAVLRLITEFQPDVVLLDIGMPGMSGYEVARTLRERHGDNCPLLIAITGFKKTSERLLGQVVGFNHYVTKPYSMDHLLTLLAPLADAEATIPGTAPEPTPQQLLLAQAVHLIGHRELANDLGVSESVLDSWMDGQIAVPHRQLLNLANVLVTVANKLSKK
ncbi:MAG TPA: response regulator [Burkholderiales bacterium]|nr:response regulator [Burkholderiales bacterium]